MDSIHSRSTASEVETRRDHRRRELVTAVFLNHLGFCNQNRCCCIRCVQGTQDIQVRVPSHLVLTVCCPSLVCKCSNVLKVFLLFLIEGLC